jgi:cholestenol Delta-isomerase
MSALLGSTNDSMPAGSKFEHPPHPFYPLEVEIVGYLANQWSVPTLLGIFLGGWLVILGLTWASVSWFSPRLRGTDKLIILWFILSKLSSLHRFSV